MASKCFMCGAAISDGILCERCDKPRKPRVKAESRPAVEPERPSPGAARHPTQSQPPLPAARGEGPRSGGEGRSAAAPALAPDAFPKAPVVPFPVESASPAITSVANVLIAAGVASIVLGP